MIEFKGFYYKKGLSTPHSVLVQFDGVVLHVWHMSEPFHRLLTSDVFRLSLSMGKRKKYIKLPNGGKIETDDSRALNRLGIDGQSVGNLCRRYLSAYQTTIAIGSALLLLATAVLIGHFIASS